MYHIPKTEHLLPGNPIALGFAIAFHSLFSLPTLLPSWGPEYPLLASHVMLLIAPLVLPPQEMLAALKYPFTLSWMAVLPGQLDGSQSSTLSR
uniref:Uncharacterized protein n=1 Tax=Picea glauca TaxID=3330 RepID=A0A101M0Q7_PICGL|nr:hypothetical protein ABT39_MTgene4222 [Picea glauca]QHR87888.1 hypothetical protein Q903MT_gene1900 [Picea sitchensis]